MKFGTPPSKNYIFRVADIGKFPEQLHQTSPAGDTQTLMTDQECGSFEDDYSSPTSQLQTPDRTYARDILGARTPLAHADRDDGAMARKIDFDAFREPPQEAAKPNHVRNNAIIGCLDDLKCLMTKKCQKSDRRRRNLAFAACEFEDMLGEMHLP